MLKIRYIMMLLKSMSSMSLQTHKTHKNIDRFNDTMRNDISAAFGVLLGDCTNVRDNLQTYLNAVAYNPDRHLFNHKIFHILGNHDIFFNGWVDFRESVGPSVYWFEVVFPKGKDLYNALDTPMGTLGSKQSKRLKTFLAENREMLWISPQERLIRHT